MVLGYKGKMLDQSYNKSVSIKIVCPSIENLQLFYRGTDTGNRLLMDLEGRKPANPFPDERSFEDSLQLNFHPGKEIAFSFRYFE